MEIPHSVSLLDGLELCTSHVRSISTKPLTRAAELCDAVPKGACLSIKFAISPKHKTEKRTLTGRAKTHPSPSRWGGQISAVTYLPLSAYLLTPYLLPPRTPPPTPINIGSGETHPPIRPMLFTIYYIVKKLSALHAEEYCTI